MFCPLCKAEYRDGFTRCNDCDAELLDTLPPTEHPQQHALVRLWLGADPVLYSALTAALQSAGIPFFDNPPRDYRNWLSAKSHTGLDVGGPNFDIQVPSHNLVVAREILQDLLNAQSLPVDNEPDDRTT